MTDTRSKQRKSKKDSEITIAPSSTLVGMRMLHQTSAKKPAMTALTSEKKRALEHIQEEEKKELKKCRALTRETMLTDAEYQRANDI